MANATHNEYRPDSVSPPGETLSETLEQIGMSQSALAERTGRPPKTINEIIKGKAAITPETAMQFERVLGVPARFWNNRERNYREYLARLEDQERLQQWTDWLQELPVNAMIKLGWIQHHSSNADQVRELLSFFGVASPEAWRELYCGHQVAYGKSRAFQTNPAALASWLRRGEIEARQIDCAPYNERRLRHALPRLRALTTRSPKAFVPEIQGICRVCGVAVAFVPEIPGTRICGAARWLTPVKALVQLSLRSRIDDHLRFTLFHELAHILLHRKRTVFVDSDAGNAFDGQDPQEEQANRFAADQLLLTSRLHQPEEAGSFQG